MLLVCRTLRTTELASLMGEQIRAETWEQWNAITKSKEQGTVFIKGKKQVWLLDMKQGLLDVELLSYWPSFLSPSDKAVTGLRVWGKDTRRGGPGVGIGGIQKWIARQVFYLLILQRKNWGEVKISISVFFPEHLKKFCYSLKFSFASRLKKLCWPSRWVFFSPKVLEVIYLQAIM